MVGRKLTERLLKDGRLGNREISGMTLQDVVASEAYELDLLLEEARASHGSTLKKAASAATMTARVDVTARVA